MALPRVLSPRARRRAYSSARLANIIMAASGRPYPEYSSVPTAAAKAAAASSARSASRSISRAMRQTAHTHTHQQARLTKRAGHMPSSGR